MSDPADAPHPATSTAAPRWGPDFFIDERFQIVSELGRGGMGAVYVVFDRELCREVALKRIHPATAGAPEVEARFRREARALAAICHPGVPQVHHSGRTPDGASWFTMEIVRGEPLRQILDRERIPARQALDVAIELGRILAAAHDAGVIHRDVKPGNIMLAPGGRVRLLDFGVCSPLPRFLEDAEARRRTADVDRWETGESHFAGTVGYSDPATHDGTPATVRSDVFSLAVILYEMLSGHRLFDVDAYCFRIIDSAELPLELAALAVDLRRAASQFPFERQRSMVEFVQRLEIARGHLERARLGAAHDRRAAPGRVTSLLLALALGVGGLLVGRSLSDAARPAPASTSTAPEPLAAAAPEPLSAAAPEPSPRQAPTDPPPAPTEASPGRPDAAVSAGDAPDAGAGPDPAGSRTREPSSSPGPSPDDAARRALRRRAARLQRCVDLYDPALRRLTVRIELDPRGAPRGVSLPGRPPSPLTLCLAAAISDLSFPPGTPSPLLHALPTRTRR